ncbi:MAG: PQQ-binding-like beta-propeller repeat protein [Planctomycetes bacterium]|nr:PQQ-binding-like beta-propeller repeat protein [Planctomycetota bacterium]MCW8136747.1 PQQ-binding-like beta-propeller repeat protein [Planctomycetota bacterium]
MRVLNFTPILALSLAACVASKPTPQPDVHRPAPVPGTTMNLDFKDLKVHEIAAAEPHKPVKLKLPNGMTGWAVRLPENFPLATPAVANGRMYVGGGFGSYSFYCIDAKSGELIWRVQTTDDGPTGAVVSGDYVAYNTESCTLEVRLCSNGELVWGRWLGDPLMSQPAIADGRVVMCWPNHGSFLQENIDPQDDDKLPDSGEMMPLQQSGEAPASGPGPVAKGTVVHGGVKVAGKGSHALGCFDLKTGQTYWAVGVPGDCISAPVIEGGRVFAATLDGTLTQVDLKTGKVLAQDAHNATSAPWVGMLNNELHAFTSQRETVTETVAGKEVKVHYESTRQFDSRNTAGFAQQRMKADWLDRRVVESNTYYGAQSKALQDSGVGFSQAPEAAQSARAADNVGEASIVGLWAFQGSRPMVQHDRLYNTLGNSISRGNLDGASVDWQINYRPEKKERLLSPPASAGGQLVFASLDGTVFTLDAKTGQVKHALKVNKNFVFQPAVMDGKLYLSTLDGWLIAIDTGDKALTGWSMWGGGPAHNGR